MIAKVTTHVDVLDLVVTQGFSVQVRVLLRRQQGRLMGA